MSNGINIHREQPPYRTPSISREHHTCVFAAPEIMDALDNIAFLLRSDGLVRGWKLVILRAESPVVVVLIIIDLTSSRGVPHTLIGILVCCGTDMVYQSTNATTEQNSLSCTESTRNLPRELRFLRLPLDFFLEPPPQSPSESLADEGVS